jgi:hypothetical protein
MALAANEMDTQGSGTRKAADPLTELAERIKSEHSAIASQMNGKGLVTRAIRLGEQLKQAKDRVEHGKWLGWLLKSCDLKERTAQRYMRLVEHRDKIDAHCKEKSVTMTDLTLNKAFALTAAPKQTQQQSSNGNGENQNNPNPDPVKLSDEIDKLVDALIGKLKVMKADKPDNAEAAVSELVEKLDLLDLLPVAGQQKKAA